MRATKLLLASALLSFGAPALADTAITGFNGGSVFPVFSSDETVGFTFSTSSNLSVTSLGWYGQPGILNSSHQIGIWNASGTLLGSGTVTAGVVPGGPSNFKYVAVSAFTLAAGGQYFIGGRDTGSDQDSYTTSVSNLTTSPLITFLGSAVSPVGAGFAFPNSVNNTTTGGRFGANFQFTDLGTNGGVPEPASWALMIGGFGLVGGVMRRRQRVAVTFA